jgi:1-acyl-sn-glycerol-3-phosphate acyltransferase
MWRSVGRFLYGIWAAATFAAVLVPTILVVAALPRLTARRRLARRAAAGIFRLAGMPVAVSGLHHIPDVSCIVVANHASYLDGIILTAVLPPRFGFVIKREMTRVPVAHFLLRRLGSEFVERFDTQKGAVDARRILQKASARESLAFFPEGTFHAEPGLRRFHNGAFTAAVRGQLPVVPVIIRGSRQLMPASRLLPRPGRIMVIVKPPVVHAAEDPVRSLAQAARQSILEELREPDLT